MAYHVKINGADVTCDTAKEVHELLGCAQPFVSIPTIWTLPYTTGNPPYNVTRTDVSSGSYTVAGMPPNCSYTDQKTQ